MLTRAQKTEIRQRLMEALRDDEPHPAVLGDLMAEMERAWRLGVFDGIAAVPDLSDGRKIELFERVAKGGS